MQRLGPNSWVLLDSTYLKPEALTPQLEACLEGLVWVSGFIALGFDFQNSAGVFRGYFMIVSLAVSV